MARRDLRGTGRRRPKRVLGRRLLKAFEILLCLGILGAFTYKFIEYAEGSTDFHIQRVEIHGLRVLDEADVLRQSGISSEGNVLFFGADEVRERVESMPYVRSCRVSLVFPQTVVLRLSEREPTATLIVNSRAYAIDAEGVVLREYGPLEMPVAPFISYVPEALFVEAGDRLSEPGLRAALALWDAFSRSPIANALTVSELAVYRVDDIRMFCDEVPYELRWGRGPVERQVKRLYLLWQKLGGALGCEEYLDLRFDADLACR